MKTPDSNLQLIAIFREDGFTLDFDPVTKKRSDTVINKEREIYRLYREDPDTCLFPWVLWKVLRSRPTGP